MSVKSITKTRWAIEPDRVTVYPYGLSFILAAVLAVLYAGLFFVFISYANMGFTVTIPVVAFFVFILLLFWLQGYTHVTFDNRTQQMRKYLFGFIPVKTIPLAKLHAINPVSNLAGSYNYRAFSTDNKYGKGTIVSCRYTKADDPNAIAFVELAIPAIYAFLPEEEDGISETSALITDYRYFSGANGIYTMKNKKIGALILGGFLIFWAVWIVFTGAMSDTGARYLVILILLGMGLVFVNAAYTKVIIDTNNQTLQRTGPTGWGNKVYNLHDFTGFQTIRQTMNFIYSGTEVQMYFAAREANKEDVIMLQNFRSSGQIERFLQEMYQIMGPIAVRNV